jgi:hypothetical protein
VVTIISNPTYLLDIMVVVSPRNTPIPPFMPTFNPAQLATLQEAKNLRGRLNSHPEFFGTVKVLPGDTLPVGSTGIYLPPWEAGPHSDPIPSGAGGKKFYHLRFSNNFEGMNVGLALDKFRRYPTSPLYVISELAKEVLSK